MTTLHQLFKSPVPKQLIYTMLKAVAGFDIKESSSCPWVFGIEEYMRGLLNNSIFEFINAVREYYHKSKQTYVNRAIKYNGVITVIRQVCKMCGIPFYSKMVYAQSSYRIVYYIEADANI